MAKNSSFNDAKWKEFVESDTVRELHIWFKYMETVLELIHKITCLIPDSFNKDGSPIYEDIIFIKKKEKEMLNLLNYICSEEGPHPIKKLNENGPSLSKHSNEALHCACRLRKYFDKEFGM